MNATVAKPEYTRNRIHPKKFALWLGCVSISMMFAAMTSAYMVRQAGGNWLEFALPPVFTLSTVVIAVSSATLFGAGVAFRRGNDTLYKILLFSTFVLGLVFIGLQYEGWMTLKQSLGLPLGTNPSSDFIYVISMIHAAHVMGGIAALTVALIHAFSLKRGITPARKLRLELTSTYWHFVDGLWVYLFIFFALLT